MIMLRCPPIDLRTGCLPTGGLCALCLLLVACGTSPQDADDPARPSRTADAPVAAPPASSQTRATISRALAQEGRSLRVLVEDLRPGERVERIVLEGPDGGHVVAGYKDIRTGRRSAGEGTSRPRVRLEGGNNDPLRMTLSLDVFSTRPDDPEPDESALAWAFLPLPDPAGYAADPGAWTVRVTLEDEVGRRLTLND